MTLLALTTLAAPSAQAAQQHSLRGQLHKSESVLRFFRTHAWLVAPRHDKCRQVPWQKSCRVGRRIVRRHQLRLPRLQTRLAVLSVPRGETALRAYINDPCLAEIIDRETAGTWSPTVYNYSGSGAYGLPQALPGSKMATAGADWRTDPRVQVAWMRSYVDARYGGSCSALAHHNSQGWY